MVLPEEGLRLLGSQHRIVDTERLMSGNVADQDHSRVMGSWGWEGAGLRVSYCHASACMTLRK